MRKTVTMSLPEPLTSELYALSRAEGTSRSEVVREALKRYFALREFRSLRAELSAEAEAKGIITDDDVFARVS